MSEFRTYPRLGTIDARPYVPGEDLARVSVSPADRERSTLDGGFIARNPANHDDQWYIAPEYFAKHYGDPLPNSQARFCDYIGPLVERDGKMVCPKCGNS